MKKINIIEKTTEDLSKQIGTYYNQILLNLFKNSNDMDETMFGKIVGYKKVKVPKYLMIKIPVIEKDYDNDSEYEDGSFRGLLISLREVKLFRIGTTIEERPIRRKTTGKSITSKRYFTRYVYKRKLI